MKNLINRKRNSKDFPEEFYIKKDDNKFERYCKKFQ